MRSAIGTTIGPATITWATNMCLYIPMYIQVDYPVARVFWINGSTVGGAAAFAIYDTDGTRIYTTGAVTTVGASDVQYVTPSAPFILKAGWYYFAYSNNGNTNRVHGTTGFTTAAQIMAGVYREISAHPPPATATFSDPTTTMYPACGVTLTESGF